MFSCAGNNVSGRDQKSGVDRVEHADTRRHHGPFRCPSFLRSTSGSLRSKLSTS
jgi:hypothetical protein